MAYTVITGASSGVGRAAALSEPENARRLYARLRAYPLRTWINNAGFGHYGPAAAQDLEKIGRMLRLNVAASYDYARHFAAWYTAEEAAACLLALYDSDRPVGLVDRKTMAFTLGGFRHPAAGGKKSLTAGRRQCYDKK